MRKVIVTIRGMNSTDPSPSRTNSEPRFHSLLKTLVLLKRNKRITPQEKPFSNPKLISFKHHCNNSERIVRKQTETRYEFLIADEPSLEPLITQSTGRA